MANPFLDNETKRNIEFLQDHAKLLDKITEQKEPPPISFSSMRRDGQKQIILGNPPSKSNCYRIITFKSKDHDRTYSSLAKTKQLKQYEDWFKLQCNVYRNAGIATDFKFEMDVFYPSRRADLDNSLKCTLDCLQMVGAIKNDNQCQEIVVRRHIDAKNPRVEFVITPLNS